MASRNRTGVAGCSRGACKTGWRSCRVRIYPAGINNDEYNKQIENNDEFPSTHSRHFVNLFPGLEQETVKHPTAIASENGC